MANQVSSFPWVIDTPSDDVLFGQNIAIRHMEFVDYNSTTDIVEVQDASGRLVWVARGNSDGLPIISDNSGYLKGLKVPVLTSAGNPNLPGGKLFIYIK